MRTENDQVPEWNPSELSYGSNVCLAACSLLLLRFLVHLHKMVPFSQFVSDLGSTWRNLVSLNMTVRQVTACLKTPRTLSSASSKNFSRKVNHNAVYLGSKLFHSNSSIHHYFCTLLTRSEDGSKILMILVNFKLTNWFTTVLYLSLDSILYINI
jgi:hypothetical protein